jgi:hypothetical protein
MIFHLVRSSWQLSAYEGGLDESQLCMLKAQVRVDVNPNYSFIE